MRSFALAALLGALLAPVSLGAQRLAPVAFTRHSETRMALSGAATDTTNDCGDERVLAIAASPLAGAVAGVAAMLVLGMLSDGGPLFHEYLRKAALIGAGAGTVAALIWVPRTTCARLHAAGL